MSSERVIEIHGLRKFYGKTVAIDGIDFSVKRGEIFALLGPNGAGKSSTLEILEGFREKSEGEIRVLGVDPSSHPSKKSERLWRERIGIVLQSAADAPDLTVEEIISHYAKYYSQKRDVEETISEVGLEDKRDAKVRTLSGGQRRRLDVALGIIGNPELLFLDEPTTGFDPEARRAFWQLIRKLRDEGRTILLTTHYLDEAEELADRVAVIHQGRVIEIATPKTLGGREFAMTEVSFLRNGIREVIATSTPTEVVQALSKEFAREIPELRVSRPTLEEIYIRMIGEANA
jgi:ABC-2 type transport system ATP-binding protein